jgi:RIO-like serine/threonine protein kinase
MFGKNVRRFLVEKQAYLLLDGSHITPQLLELGSNYLRMEKYDTSLETALINNMITPEQYRGVYGKILTMIKQLDSFGLIHNDLHPRNIVCKNNFTECAIIDFELSIIVEVGARTNLDMNFYHNF